MRETWFPPLAWEDPLKEGLAPTLVFLPGESPWTEKPGRLQFIGSQRVRHDWATKHTHAAAAAKSLQSCPTLCDPIDGGPPGSPVPGILQARTLEWVAISFSNAWKWKVKVKLLSRVRLLVTHGLQPTRLLRPWDFPGKSTGVGVPLPSLDSTRLSKLKSFGIINRGHTWDKILIFMLSVLGKPNQR